MSCLRVRNCCLSWPLYATHQRPPASSRQPPNRQALNATDRPSAPSLRRQLFSARSSKRVHTIHKRIFLDIIYIYMCVFVWKITWLHERPHICRNQNGAHENGWLGERASVCRKVYICPFATGWNRWRIAARDPLPPPELLRRRTSFISLPFLPHFHCCLFNIRSRCTHAPTSVGIYVHIYICMQSYVHNEYNSRA